MRRLLARLTVPAFLLGACRGPSREPGHSVIQDRIPLPGLSPAALALSEFRPRVRADVDTGGRCREDFYWSARGYRAVVWRRDGENRRFWTIQVATDSAGVVRRYYEDRYGSTAGRTIILVDFDAGRGSVENDIPDLPAQTAAADAATVFHAPQLDDPSLQAARILERCRASLDPWGSLARFPDSLTAPPPPRPLPRAASVDRSFRDSTLGVGYLAPGADGVNSFSGFEWFRHVIVPVYDGPSGPVAAWLARGWMARRGAPLWSWGEWTVGGWIGTSSEGTALPVLALRDDGWLRLGGRCHVGGHTVGRPLSASGRADVLPGARATSVARRPRRHQRRARLARWEGRHDARVQCRSPRDRRRLDEGSRALAGRMVRDRAAAYGAGLDPVAAA